jgi:hypothetical protein
MRVTGPKSDRPQRPPEWRAVGGCLVLVLIGVGVLKAAEATPLASIAKIATALSEGDADGVLEYFDSQMKGFPDLEQKIQALTEQADVSCAIDVVTDTEAAGVHKLDLDWYMQLSPESATGPLERRRERVQVEMKLIKKAWRITSISPTTIFEPIQIK